MINLKFDDDQFTDDEDMLFCPEESDTLLPYSDDDFDEEEYLD